MFHFPPRLRPFAAALLFLAAAPLQATDHVEDPALLNVREIAPGVVIDMRYATPDNFTGHTLYPMAECLLCEPAAHRLARVQKKLRKKGFGLKVWDCYRPLSVQKKLWDIVPDPRYVADPKTGSRHNRGASVDLTLVDKHGHELPMPTKFDDFSERAHRSFMDLPADALKNRQILQEAMESEGFIGLPTEWWHFDDPEWKNYALRDEPLGVPALRKEKLSDEQPRLLVDDIRQLVVVLADNWQSAGARLQRYERTNKGWVKAGESWKVSLGKNGLRWGRGLQLDMMSGPPKREGDLTAPAGVYPIGRAYGYATEAPTGVKWPYSPLSERTVCVDDPKSSRYNQIFEADPATKDWSSAETMRRTDHLYRWLLNVDQNMPANGGCGSCIFMHIWRKPGAYTEGCTAMEEANLLTLIGWLDPDAHPTLVQLPADEYAKYRDAWDLP